MLLNILLKLFDKIILQRTQHCLHSW